MWQPRPAEASTTMGENPCIGSRVEEGLHLSAQCGTEH